MRIFRFVLPLLVVLAVCSPAYSQTDTRYFLKLDQIPGESTDAQHPNEIEVLSAAIGVLQPQLQRFAGGGASASKTEVSPIAISKFVDKSSPVLFLNCATGKRIPTAVLTARRSAEPPVDYYTITLSDVLISSVSQGASEGGVIETVNLSFSKITLTYVPSTANGTPGTPVTVSFDLKANKPFTPPQ